MKLFKALLAEYKPISYNCASIFVHTFKRYGQNYASNDVQIQHTIRNLLDKCDNIINSNLVRTLVTKENVELNVSFHICFPYILLIFFNMNIWDTAIETFICTHAVYDALKDKTNVINQNVINQNVINQNVVHPTTSPSPNQTSSLKEVTPQSSSWSSTAASATSTSSNKSSTLKRVANDDPSPSSQNKRRGRYV